ncbi:hypothetical protein [Immundisolibacter sp.]|uniref:hypothetical protein n=1 Tax=Immundisolibacter sp. TaxID=1934948 RepID=UPI002B267EE0|nr:hypothetical protein [Immundisolibacter sp.]
MPSLLVCFLASTVPPLWDRLIARPRLCHCDRHFASTERKELARRANQAAGWAV